jgi:predicted methyltransferase
MIMRIAIALLFSVVTLSAQGRSDSQVEAKNHILNDPLRDPWQMPDQVISALNFSPAETVAVVENGYPYFAPRIAPLVKKVYALNADQRAFQGRGKLPSSVSPIVAGYTDPNVAGINADTVLMIDVLRFLPQRSIYYLMIAAALKPGGRLVIIDRIGAATVPASARITDVSLEKELPPAGFGLLQKFNFLPYQYFIVFHHL